jgi:hypothetical protein
MFFKMSSLAKISKEPHYINQCCESAMFIPDPESEGFHLGFRVNNEKGTKSQIPDPQQRILPKKNVP